MIWTQINLAMFTPMMGMLAVFAFNNALQHRRSSVQVTRDARGVRAALLAELILLRKHLAENLSLIERGEEYLLSLRVLTQVYRSYVGRLNLLHEADIDAVVSAYGMAEAAEVFISATTKSHGPNAYRVWLGDSSWKEAGGRLRAAFSAVEMAIGSLDQAGRYASIEQYTYSGVVTSGGRCSPTLEEPLPGEQRR